MYTHEDRLDWLAIEYGCLGEQTPSYVEPDEGAFDSVIDIARKRLAEPDFITFAMYYEKNFTQVDIGRRLGIAQPSVHERIQSSIAMVRWWLNAPPIPSLDVCIRVLGPHLSTIRVESLWLWCEGQRQQAVARWHSSPASTTKTRIRTAIDKLESLSMEGGELGRVAKQMLERAAWRDQKTVAPRTRWCEEVASQPSHL